MALYTQRKNWLGSEEGLVVRTFEVPATTAYVLENDRKIVKSGTYFATPYKGLLFEDADITDGAVAGSIMIRGSYIDANLPASVASYVTDLKAQGLFAIAEDGVTRPSFGTGELSALNTPTVTTDIANASIDWTDIAYEIGYFIYKDGEIVDEVASGTATYAVDATGSWQVQGKADNLTYAHSALSTAVEVQPTVLAMPASAAANDTTDVLSWTLSTGAKSYNVYKAGTVVATTNATTNTINVAAYGTSNAYKIEAVGDGVWYSNSPLTAALSVTV